MMKYKFECDYTYSALRYSLPRGALETKMAAAGHVLRMPSRAGRQVDSNTFLVLDNKVKNVCNCNSM